MNNKNLINQAESAIRYCLKSLSFLSIKEVQSEFKQDKVQADLWVRLEGADNYPDLVVVAKSKGEPRFIRDAVNQLLRYLDYIPNTYGLIVAPYISQRSAEICKEEGIGYIDLSGNCYLSFHQVYIEKEGKPNTKLEKKILKALNYPKAERVLRVLLNNPNMTWKTENLTNEANVSTGMVSKVKQRLDAMEWIKTGPSGFQIRDWTDLLDTWQKEYKFSRNTIYNLYSLKPPDSIEKDIADYCREKDIPYALTLFSAASRLAPYTRYKRVYAYIDTDIDLLKDVLDLKDAPTGPNVTLLLPYDQGVFYGLKEYEGLPVVSPVQLYLDLISNKGRGEEAAQFLFDKVIKPQWSQK